MNENPAVIFPRIFNSAQIYLAMIKGVRERVFSVVKMM